MNIAKNMEAIFFAALVVVGATGFASAAVPAHHAVRHSAQVEGKMQVVTIVGHRLHAVDKAQSVK